MFGIFLIFLEIFGETGMGFEVLKFLGERGELALFREGFGIRDILVIWGFNFSI